MTKLSLAVCALSMILFACNKDNTPQKSPDAVKKVPISIRANDFSQHVEVLPNGKTQAVFDSLLATKVSHIYYLLYDDGDNFIKYLHSDVATDPNFGSIFDTTAPGYYKIVLIASQTPLDVSTAPLYANTFSLPVAPGGKIENTPDIFYVKERVWVQDDYGNKDLVLNLGLDRIVGNLQVDILDMPNAGAGDTTASVTITPEANYFNLNTGTTPTTMGDTLQGVLRRISNTTFSAYVLNTDVPFTVTIHYIDAVTGQPATRVINNVTCYKSRKTYMSGYVYGTKPESTGIKIILLDGWYGPTTNIDF